ncbi:hypothetical protein BJ742DRAFT_536151 [Cladochytrium replicatum]|nr:hypothetical protein BJ742DRAFT_536151 [Cladochytrium replicatum]
MHDVRTIINTCFPTLRARQPSLLAYCRTMLRGDQLVVTTQRGEVGKAGKIAKGALDLLASIDTRGVEESIKSFQRQIMASAIDTGVQAAHIVDYVPIVNLVAGLVKVVATQALLTLFNKARCELLAKRLTRLLLFFPNHLESKDRRGPGIVQSLFDMKQACEDAVELVTSFKKGGKYSNILSRAFNAQLIGAVFDDLEARIEQIIADISFGASLRTMMQGVDDPGIAKGKDEKHIQLAIKRLRSKLEQKLAAVGETVRASFEVGNDQLKVEITRSAEHHEQTVAKLGRSVETWIDQYAETIIEQVNLSELRTKGFMMIAVQELKDEIGKKIDTGLQDLHRNVEATLNLQLRIPHSTMKHIKLLSSRPLNRVYLFELTTDSESTKVVVKTVADENFKRLGRELSVLAAAFGKLGSSRFLPEVIGRLQWKFDGDPEPMDCIVTEYLRGPELDAFLSGPTRLSLPAKLGLIYQIASAVEFLHSDLRFAHGSLSTSQIMLSFDPYSMDSDDLSKRLLNRAAVKLIDFDQAVSLPPKAGGDCRNPHVLKDLQALAWIVWQILYRSLPGEISYINANGWAIEILPEEEPLPDPYPYRLPPSLREILQSLLKARDATTLPSDLTAGRIARAADPHIQQSIGYVDSPLVSALPVFFAGDSAPAQLTQYAGRSGSSGPGSSLWSTDTSASRRGEHLLASSLCDEFENRSKEWQKLYLHRSNYLALRCSVDIEENPETLKKLVAAYRGEQGCREPDAHFVCVLQTLLRLLASAGNDASHPPPERAAAPETVQPPTVSIPSTPTIPTPAPFPADDEMALYQYTFGKVLIRSDVASDRWACALQLLKRSARLRQCEDFLRSYVDAFVDSLRRPNRTGDGDSNRSSDVVVFDFLGAVGGRWALTKALHLGTSEGLWGAWSAVANALAAAETEPEILDMAREIVGFELFEEPMAVAVLRSLKWGCVDIGSDAGGKDDHATMNAATGRAATALERTASSDRASLCYAIYYRMYTRAPHPNVPRVAMECLLAAAKAGHGKAELEVKRLTL